MDGKRWFEVIMRGNPVDNVEGDGETGIDHAATHRNRDRILINRARMYGEMLTKGMADPRRIGQDLIDMANEADSIEKLMFFGYE
jgi:hypothetical protein